jgi:hypothetical protein
MMSKSAKEMQKLAQIAEEILNESNGEFDYDEWTQWLRNNSIYDDVHEDDEIPEDEGPFCPLDDITNKYGNNYQAIFNALKAQGYPEDYICGAEHGSGAFGDEKPHEMVYNRADYSKFGLRKGKLRLEQSVVSQLQQMFKTGQFDEDAMFKLGLANTLYNSPDAYVGDDGTSPRDLFDLDNGKLSHGVAVGKFCDNWEGFGENLILFADGLLHVEADEDVGGEIYNIKIW